jgi:cobaltochelatase CobN
MALLVLENPFPTPPHKGEGLSRGIACLPIATLPRRERPYWGGPELHLSLSPLWGGVGEGFSTQIGGLR